MQPEPDSKPSNGDASSPDSPFASSKDAARSVELDVFGDPILSSSPRSKPTARRRSSSSRTGARLWEDQWEKLRRRIRQHFEKPVPASRSLGLNTAEPPPSFEDMVYSVPRRFDLSTMFAVSTAFGLLFAVLAYVGFESSVKLMFCAYFSGVGLAQAVMFGGEAPRRASIVSGAVLLWIVMIPFVHEELLVSFLLSALYMPFGCLTGYLTGGLVGGVFLIADAIRRRFVDHHSPTGLMHHQES